jgi:hypothetical protein
VPQYRSEPPYDRKPNPMISRRRPGKERCKNMHPKRHWNNPLNRINNQNEDARRLSNHPQNIGGTNVPTPHRSNVDTFGACNQKARWDRSEQVCHHRRKYVTSYQHAGKVCSRDKKDKVQTCVLLDRPSNGKSRMRGGERRWKFGEYVPLLIFECWFAIERGARLNSSDRSSADRKRKPVSRSSTLRSKD